MSRSQLVKVQMHALRACVEGREFCKVAGAQFANLSFISTSEPAVLCQDAADFENSYALVEQVALRQPRTRIRAGHGAASFRGLTV
jgi:hypothetical protein